MAEKQGQRRDRRVGCLLVLVTVLAVPWFCWELYSYRYYQGWLPQGVDAPIVQYKKVATPGFGPGGQDTGLLVMHMTDQSANLLEREGLVFLQNSRSSRANDYYGWAGTPVVPMWSGHGEHSCGREPGIAAYVDYGDFRCHLKASVVAEINRIISSPGAYYARGSGSRVIIVAPQHRKVIIAFNG